MVARRNLASNLPSLIGAAGDRASLRFLEYFTVNIRNQNPRVAYVRAAADFLGWCEGQGIGELGRVQPVHAAAYIELHKAGAPLPGSSNGLSEAGLAESRDTASLIRLLTRDDVRVQIAPQLFTLCCISDETSPVYAE